MVSKKIKNFIKSTIILIKIIDKLKRYIISIIENEKILLVISIIRSIRIIRSIWTIQSMRIIKRHIIVKILDKQWNGGKHHLY